MNAHLESQYELVARWQLTADRWSTARIDHALGKLRQIHDGVHTSARGTLTRLQLWMAATLTAPGSVLSHASAAALWGIRPWKGGFEVVTRRGTGGPKRLGDVLVMRSGAVERTTHRGIPVTPVARTLLDLAAHVPARELRRMFFEALRLRLVTDKELADCLARRPGVRGARAFRELTEAVRGQAFGRTRSAAECEALWQLIKAGDAPEAVNKKVAGYEADFIWWSTKTIVEIDGPGFHLDAELDARKRVAWEAAGWTVLRIPSPTVFGG